MRLLIIISAVMASLAGGCFGQVTRCLETPVNEDVGQVATDRCSRAMGDNLEDRDLFDHFMAILRVQGRYVDIIAWSQRVLESDPARYDAMYHLAVGLRKDGQCEAAIARYRQFALKMPDEADPYYGMALCFEEIGDRLAAVQAYSTYIKKETRDGQEAWVEKARERVAALEAGGAVGTVDPDAGKPAPPAEPEPAPEPEPAAEPAPEPAAEPAPEPAPAPAPEAAPTPTDCSKPLAKIKKDPFDTAAYEAFSRCSLARKAFKDLLKRLKIGMRDNPGFDRGWYHMGEAHAGLGENEKAKFAYSQACKKGVNEACSKF